VTRGVTRGHLGDLAAALVDGELGHDARDRALAHLAGCLECRAEVESQRRLKARLARLVDPVPPAELAARIGSFASCAAAPPGRRVLRRGSRSARRPARVGRRPVRQPRGALRLTVAGAAGGAVLGAVGFLAAAPTGGTAVPARPVIHQINEQVSLTTNPLMELPEPMFGITTVSYPAPAGPMR